MVFNALFLEKFGTPGVGVPIPPLTVCLPVRMGTVSACNWMPVLALWSGWSLHCGTASE